MTTREPIVVSWSGGKDSSLALYAIQQSGEYEVTALLCSVSQEYQRISHHGVRVELLEAQAEALELPLYKLELPAGPDGPCTNNVYEEIMERAMRHFLRQGVRRVAFGDIFLEDLRKYREQNLARLAMQGLFPLWKQDTRELVERFLGLGFRAWVTCVEGKLGPRFVGRPIDHAFVAELPEEVDPCGENGEYHSFVHAGPIFRRPLRVELGEVVCRDTRYYADLLPAGADEATSSPASAGDIPPV